MLPSVSTPPWVAFGRLRFAALDCLDCGSEGPRSSLVSQWSPTFSNEYLTADQAVWCARASLWYCSSAESSVSA